MYPLKEGPSIGVNTVQFVDFSEQRSQRHELLHQFTIKLTKINGNDVSKVRAFFNSMKGQFDSTWDITCETVLFDNMTFIEDILTVVNVSANRYTISLAVRQTVPT